MKAKFYSIRSLFFTLLLSCCFAGTINAQAIALSVEDYTTGGDGTQAGTGDRLIYYIVVTGPVIMINPNVICPVPAGTFYVPGSTTLNNVPFPDQNNTMPWATGGLIPVPGASGEVKIKFEVEVSANTGAVTGEARLQTVNYPLAISNQTVTNVQVNPYCNSYYTLTTSTAAGKNPANPSLYFPYRYIRTINLTIGTSNINFFNGVSGACKNAYDNSILTTGSVLTDASAMAFEPSYGRIFFVNNPVNNQPAELCYVGNDCGPSPGTCVVTAFKYVGTPLTTNTTSTITRMTFDAMSNGYAITDNGQEFIHFTINGYPGIPSINSPQPLINDPGNGAHDVLAETGGDICADGGGKLLLIPNSGNVYRINPGNRMATYLGTIAGFPATGCRSVAIDNAGIIYIGGNYQTLYKLMLSTLTLTSVSNSLIYTSSDFAACTVPPQPARIATNENLIRNEAGVAQLSSEVSARVQPNPFKKVLNVQVQLNTTEVVRVRLIDFYGRTVYARSERLSTGSNSLNITVPEGLGSGMYVLELWAGNNRLLQKKLLKQ